MNAKLKNSLLHFAFVAGGTVIIGLLFGLYSSKGLLPDNFPTHYLVELGLFGPLSIFSWYLFFRNPNDNSSARLVLFGLGLLFYIPFAIAVFNLCLYAIDPAGYRPDLTANFFDSDRSIFWGLIIFGFMGASMSFGIYTWLFDWKEPKRKSLAAQENDAESYHGGSSNGF